MQYSHILNVDEETEIKVHRSTANIISHTYFEAITDAKNTSNNNCKSHYKVMPI